MKKKLLALILVFSMIALNGCGSNSSGSEENLKKESSQAENAEVNNTEAGNTEEEAFVYVQPEMKGEITVSCLFSQELFETAAKGFMDKYPDVKVTIHVYSEGLEENAVENYLTSLNTKLMSGTAEDIIIANFLPVGKYAEMGVFEDMSKYVVATPEFNNETYFMNVLQAAKEDTGELYILPYIAKFNTVGFSEVLLSGNENVENALKGLNSISFSQAMDLAEQLVDGTNRENAFLERMNENSYMNYLVENFLERFLNVSDKKVNFDTKEYVELLTEVKGLSEKGYFESEDINYYNTEYDFAAICDYDVQNGFYCLDKEKGMAYCMPLSDEKGNISISANTCLALNGGSGNKELAWEFIKYLLSEEMQTMPAVQGLAVNRKGFEAAALRYYKLYSDGNADGAVSQEDYYKVLKKWMEQVNDCNTLDFSIAALIEKENGKFFSGQQTAEDTAGNIQRQIEQYLYESSGKEQLVQ